MAQRLRSRFDGLRCAFATLTLGQAFTFVTFALVATLAAQPSTDPDKYWHLATGKWIIGHWRVPKGDVFSWTAPGRAWIAHEWLTETVWYGSFKVLGWAGPALLSAATICAGFWLIKRTADRFGVGKLITSALIILAALSSLSTWGVRPQMISFALTALIGRLTSEAWADADSDDTSAAKRSRNRLFWLIPVMLAWVNLHGGFMFGLALLLAFSCGLTCEYAVGHFWRWYRLQRPFAVGRATPELIGVSWIVTLGSIAATLVNPNGLKGLTYPFTYLGNNASTRYLDEWRSPDLAKAQYWPFLFISILAVIAIVRRRHAIPLYAAVQIVAFGFLAFQSIRNITPFVALALIWIAESFRSLRAKLVGDKIAQPILKGPVLVHQVLLLASLVVALVAITRSSTPGSIHRAEAKTYPLAAVQWLKDHPRERVLNEYEWGGYLIWNNPTMKVAIDGRPDMYGDAFVDRHISIWFAYPGWQAKLDADHYDRIVAEPGRPIVAKLRNDLNWRISYEDNAAVILDRV